MISPRTLIGVLVGLLLVLYAGPLLLDAPLTDPDEGLHAAIVQEMHQSGELIVPRFLGEAFLDKPILYFWTQLGSTAVFGMNAAAMRLPGLLFAMLGIITTGWLARALFGGTTGWLAATCYATLAIPFGLAQAPVHDIALVPMTNLALLAFWRLAANRSGLYVWPAGLMLGLSVLTKGLAAVSVVGLAFGLTLIARRQLTFRLALYGAAALALAAAVAAPWYLIMEARQPGYLHYYFVSRHLLGLVTDTQPHSGMPWWFYLPVLGAGGLPWVLYAWTGRGEVPHAERNAHLMLWLWAIGTLVMLSAAGSKLVTYALPAFPPVAMLAARQWSLAMGRSDGAGTLRVQCRLHALVFAVAMPLLPWAATRIGGGSVEWPVWVAFAAAGAAWLWLLAVLQRQPLPSAWLRLTLGTGAAYACAVLLLGPSIAEAHSARALAERLNQWEQLPPAVLVAGERIGSVVFYLRPDLRRSLDPVRLRRADAGGAAEAAGAGDVIAVPREDVWRLGDTLTAWRPFQSDAGRYVIFGPRPVPD